MITSLLLSLALVSPDPAPESPASAPSHNAPVEETQDTREPSIGGFGGPRLRPAAVGNDFGLLIGGGGGAIFNGRFMIGGEGFGMAAFAGSAGTIAIDGERKALALTMGYGGLKLGWIFARTRLLDFAIQALIGGGGVAVDDVRRPKSPYVDSARMFVAVPEAVVYFKVARVFRLGVSASYRVVAHERWSGPSGASLMGPAGTVVFDWGMF